MGTTRWQRSMQRIHAEFFAILRYDDWRQFVNPDVVDPLLRNILAA
jgi:hypothetical protein